MRSFVGNLCCDTGRSALQSEGGFAILLGTQTCRTASRSVKYGSSVLNKCARNVRRGMT